jgi:glycosyltransferase involved in cell wall biosynthesis
MTLVSVIVPVLNDESRIRRCVESLLNQTYPEERREVIIVDNGSSDGTRDVVATYPVRLLVEESARTPYVARNKGIHAASGDVIALTDADCAPDPDWIARGVELLERSGADLVGGKVEFSFSPNARPGEWYDAISNLEMERNISERGVAKTANLFFRRRVVDEIGPFPAWLRSGGDVWWTGRASRAGLRIEYAPDARVVKPARSFGALLKKQYRVGQGQPELWRAAGRSWSAISKQLLKGFLPPAPHSIRRSIRQRGIPEMETALSSLWCVAWACRVTTNAGRITALTKLQGGSRPDDARSS